MESQQPPQQQPSVGADSLEAPLNADAAAAGDAGDICRDFLRHVCKRGRRCRYRHPEASPPPPPLPPPTSATSLEPLVFCHDYQNGGCQRPACRFVHCSREEEVTFRTTGRLPDRFVLALAGESEEPQPPQPQPPVCKDHLKGECKRGGRCRFRHLDAAALQLPPTQPQPLPPLPFDFLTAAGLDPSTAAAAALMMMGGGGGGGGGAGGLKRRRLEFEPQPQPPPPPPPQHLPTLSSPFHFLPQQPPTSLADALQAENALLKRRLDELRRQCGELMVTNELLAEQNSRLRQQQSQPQPQQPPHTSQLEALTALPAAYSDFAYSALFAFPQAVTQTVTSAGMKSLPSQYSQ